MRTSRSTPRQLGHRHTTVVRQEYGFGGNEGIVVNGSMTASGTTFKLAGGGDNAQIVVNGPLRAPHRHQQLVFLEGPRLERRLETDDLQYVAFATELATMKHGSVS